MTEFVKGKVFTIAEVRENKDGQILAKVVSSTPSKFTELSRFIESFIKFYQEVKFYCVAQVDGLIEGYQYSFRVKAVNLGSTVNFCVDKIRHFLPKLLKTSFAIFCRGCRTSLPPPYHQKL